MLGIKYGMPYKANSLPREIGLKLLNNLGMDLKESWGIRSRITIMKRYKNWEDSFTDLRDPQNGKKHLIF